MSGAVLPESQRKEPPLPRSNSRLYTGKSKLIATSVGQFNGASAARRCQHLPDFEPGVGWAQIEERLRDRFMMTRIATRKAVRGKARAVVVSGPGGVGKTFEIDKTLEEAFGDDDGAFTSSSGYATPVGVYKLLYKHRHKGQMIKFDDSDSLFYNENTLNFLKVACDTTRNRTIAYRSECILDDDNEQPIPKVFDFHGTIIFVSNLDFDEMIDRGTKLAPHPEALTTRSLYINVGMRTKYDYLVRLFMSVYPSDADRERGVTGLFDEMDLEENQISEIMDFIEKNHRLLRECSLRMGLKIAALREMADEDDELPWQQQAVLTCCRNGVEITEEVDEEVDIAPIKGEGDEEIEAVVE